MHWAFESHGLVDRVAGDWTEAWLGASDERRKELCGSVWRRSSGVVVLWSVVAHWDRGGGVVRSPFFALPRAALPTRPSAPTAAGSTSSGSPSPATWRRSAAAAQALKPRPIPNYCLLTSTYFKHTHNTPTTQSLEKPPIHNLQIFLFFPIIISQHK